VNYGDFAEGTTIQAKQNYHRNWWFSADLHEPDYSDNDLTWYEFALACPNMDVTGSPAPPEPPLKFKTPEELTVITQSIKDENTIPSWEWTDYIYGTIIPHIDELHEAGQLVEVDEDDEPSSNYNFKGFRNIETGNKEGWGCTSRIVASNNSGDICQHWIDGESNGLAIMWDRPD